MSGMLFKIADFARVLVDRGNISEVDPVATLENYN